MTTSNTTFTTCTAASDSLRLVVVPELGAKIVSLQSVRSGREWMWRATRDAALFRNTLTDPFERSTLTGADECLPTVDPCNWQGRNLPDHGEVWASEWQVDQAQLRWNTVHTEIELPISPLTLKRSISVRGSKAAFEYTLLNRSPDAQKFLWAFHPLFPVEEDTTIELPGQIEQVRMTNASGVSGAPESRDWPWPQPAPGVRLDRLDFGGKPASAKLFADFSSVEHGFAALRQDKERLVFEFDRSDVPFLGIWITRNSWNGYTHLAIEPTNASCDSLRDVPEADRTVIPGLGKLEWSFRITLQYT
jgi:galactose mutarotase-like enzyme